MTITSRAISNLTSSYRDSYINRTDNIIAIRLTQKQEWNSGTALHLLSLGAALQVGRYAQIIKFIQK